MGAIRPGDAVWDIGANVGQYSELFCKMVGERGSVVCFEPLPQCCDAIRARVPNCGWVRVENVALGNEDTTGRLMVTEESFGNHVATGREEGESISVQICRGDTVSQRLGQVPNVLKVDVEGFEEEVLQGMPQVLASATLRSVLVEVHFSKLETRGRSTAPIRIEKLLGDNGFRTTWVDSSHLFASR